jgi:hypothetical protein
MGKAKPHQSKLDFRVRELKRENASSGVSNEALPCSSLGRARQTYIEKSHRNVSCTYCIVLSLKASP